MNHAGKILIAIFLFAGYDSAFAQNGESPFVIRYVLLVKETPIIIPPSNFDSAFEENQYRIWEPSTTEEEDSLYIYFKQFIKIKTQDVNIRAKIIYTVGKRSISIFLSNTGIFSDGFYCFDNKNLYRFLRQKLSAP